MKFKNTFFQIAKLRFSTIFENIPEFSPMGDRVKGTRSIHPEKNLDIIIKIGQFINIFFSQISFFFENLRFVPNLNMAIDLSIFKILGPGFLQKSLFV